MSPGYKLQSFNSTGNLEIRKVKTGFSAPDFELLFSIATVQSFKISKKHTFDENNFSSLFLIVVEFLPSAIKINIYWLQTYFQNVFLTFTWFKQNDTNEKKNQEQVCSNYINPVLSLMEFFVWASFCLTHLTFRPHKRDKQAAPRGHFCQSCSLRAVRLTSL